jgi:ubiquinone/menaquinone biosynthesis C-methylase UbiE
MSDTRRAQRYDRLADIIPFFDWLFFIPAGLRKHAVDRLSLKPGDCVLDVGCGTGRNFPFLREAIGPSGRIYGVDLSAGMLRKARKRDRHHPPNRGRCGQLSRAGTPRWRPLQFVIQHDARII